MRSLVITVLLLSSACASMPASRGMAKDAQAAKVQEDSDIRNSLARLESKIEQLQESIASLATKRVQDREAERDDMEKVIESVRAQLEEFGKLLKEKR